MFYRILALSFFISLVLIMAPYANAQTACGSTYGSFVCSGGSVVCNISGAPNFDCGVTPSCAGEKVQDCSSCPPACICPSGQTDCGGNNCEASDGACATLNRSTTNVCVAPDSCGSCLSGFTDLTPETLGDACVGNRPAVTLAPYAVQADDQNTNPSIWINKTGTGHMLRFQGSGSDKVVVTNSGQLVLGLSSTDWTTFTQAVGAGQNLIYGGITSASSGNILLFEKQGTPNLTLLRLDSSGNLLIGGNTTLTGNTILGTSTTDNWTSIRGTLIVNGEYMVMSRKDGVPTQNPSLGSIPAGALYYRTTAGDSGLKVYNGNAWGALGGGGLATSGTTTVGKISKFIGTPLTLTDSLLTEASGTVSVGGNITATGCFGAVYRQMSADPGKDGDIDEDTGGANGYSAANALCNAALGGSHVCTTNEMLQSINCGALTSAVSGGLLAIGNEMWISNGAPSLPTPTNDCFGWTDNQAASQGIKWQYQSNGGVFYAENCNVAHQFACCK